MEAVCLSHNLLKAEEYKHNLELFKHKAAQHTAQHANQGVVQVILGHSFSFLFIIV